MTAYPLALALVAVALPFPQPIFPPQPPTAKKATKVIATPTLPRGARVEIARVKPLQEATKRQLLEDIGVENPGGVGKARRLSVREPYAGSGAFIAFVGASAVNPAEGPLGTASVGATPKNEPTFALEMPGLPFGRPAPLDNALIVDFRAKKNHDYVVECSWHGRPRPSGSMAQFWEPLEASDLYTEVKVADSVLEGGTAHFDHVIVQGIPAPTKDTRVVVKVKSERGFLASQCTITPFRRGKATPNATTHKAPFPKKKKTLPGPTPTFPKP